MTPTSLGTRLSCCRAMTPSGTGRAMMNVRSPVRIAEALGIDPGALLDGVTSEMFSG